MNTALFKSNAALFNLNKHSVHVYYGSIENYINEIENYFLLLDEEEKKRALAFKFEKDKALFVISHGLLRKILAAYTEISAGSIVFSKNKSGKPYIENSLLQFNLSHSGKHFAIAVSNANAVGVDMEEVNVQFDFTEIVKQHFSTEEKIQIKNSGNSHQTFFMLWTQKEAYLKMKGIGLNENVNLTEVQKTVQLQTKLFGNCALSVCASQLLAINYFAL